MADEFRNAHIHFSITPSKKQYRSFQKGIKNPDAELYSLDERRQIAEIRSYNIDVNLKFIYAIFALAVLLAQLVFMNWVFYLVGRGCLKYIDAYDLKIFMTGTLAEVFGIVFVITSYLFPSSKPSKKSN